MRSVMLNLRLSSIGEQAHFCAFLLNMMLAHVLPKAMVLVRLNWVELLQRGCAPQCSHILGPGAAAYHTSWRVVCCGERCLELRTGKRVITMSQEPTNPALERLTEETAEAILYTIGATTGDPKPAVVQLLLSYLSRAHEQPDQDVPREQHQAKQGQQN